MNMFSRYKWSTALMNNLFDCMQCTDHAQYNDYKTSLMLAKKYSHCWLPLGILENEINRFSRAHQLIDQKERHDLIIKTMPLADVNTKRSNHLTSHEKKVANGIINSRNRNDIGIGLVKLKKHDLYMDCYACRKNIRSGSYYATLFGKHGQDKVWCVDCFRCRDCNSVLPDNIYYMHQANIYCLKHYGEKFRPRCKACCELIYGDEYTKAIDNNFHLDHFICHSCNICLTEEKYVVKNDEAYCLDCYDDRFAENCYACKEKIRCRDKGLSFKNWFWHDTCFKCNGCKTQLCGNPFAIKDNEIFCSKCYEKHNAISCDGCNRIFEAGTRTFEFRNKRWHDKCFLCDFCQRPIGTSNFIPSDKNTPICLPCHEKSVAPKCYKCRKSITSTGVTYKGSTWHSTCFLCGCCKTELVGCKFTMKQDTPYCGDCYGKHFAKRCGKCHQPISGFNGDQFVIFENINYHSRCFNCHRCNASVINTGFIYYDNSFICPNCSRNEKHFQPKVRQQSPAVNRPSTSYNGIGNQPTVY